MSSTSSLLAWYRKRARNTPSLVGQGKDRFKGLSLRCPRRGELVTTTEENDLDYRKEQTAVSLNLFLPLCSKDCFSGRRLVMSSVKKGLHAGHGSGVIVVLVVVCQNLQGLLALGHRFQDESSELSLAFSPGRASSEDHASDTVSSLLRH